MGVLPDITTAEEDKTMSFAKLALPIKDEYLSSIFRILSIR